MACLANDDATTLEYIVWNIASAALTVVAMVIWAQDTLLYYSG